MAVEGVVRHASCLQPDSVKLMGEAFDHAWSAIEPDYQDRRQSEVDVARLALAKAVVLFAGLGNTDRDVLKSKALRVMQTPGIEAAQ